MKTIKELRIGNHISTSLGVNMYVVGLSDNGKVQLNYKGNKVGVYTEKVKDIEGIELSVPLIEKIGFKESEKSYETHRRFVYEKTFVIVFSSKKFYYKTSSGIHIEVDTLHHLQNLCFDTTGKEMNINFKI